MDGQGASNIAAPVTRTRNRVITIHLQHRFYYTHSHPLAHPAPRQLDMVASGNSSGSTTRGTGNGKTTKKQSRAATDTSGGKRTKKAKPSPVEGGSEEGAAPSAAQLLIDPSLADPERDESAHPVLTKNELLLDGHARLIKPECQDDAYDELLEAGMTAVIKKMADKKFNTEKLIDELGDNKLSISDMISGKMIRDFKERFATAADAREAHELGQLMKSDVHFKEMNNLQTEVTRLKERLEAAETQLAASSSESVTAIDNALGTVQDKVAAMSTTSKSAVTKIITSYRKKLEDGSKFDSEFYAALNLDAGEPISKPADLESETQNAMSSDKNQSFCDKYKDAINDMDDDDARTALEHFHQRLISSNANYDPRDSDDFPKQKSEFKKKFGLSRIEFWKMKALEKRLSCPASPGAAVTETDVAAERAKKISYFSSLSPSPATKLVFDDEDEEISADDDEKSDSDEGDSVKTPGEKEDDMLKTSNDKMFEKAVDWTQPAVKRIAFSSTSEEIDIHQFITDFEEVMTTRAPYSMYEVLLERLTEPAVASAVREYTRNAVSELPTTSVIEKRRARIAMYKEAKQFLLDHYADDERGAKLLKKFDSISMAVNSKVHDSYVKYKMNLDKLRRQLTAIETDLLTQPHYMRRLLAGLSPKLKQKLEESDDYDDIKNDEGRLNSKLHKWSKAMQRSTRTSTLNTITEEDSEDDVNTEGFEALRAFFKSQSKREFKRKPGGKEGSEHKKQKKDPSTYVDVKDIQENKFKNCYTKQEWQARRRAREQNEEYSKQPHLYSKDKLKGKPCCVKCRRVGHTANECRRGSVHMSTLMKELKKLSSKEGEDKSKLLAAMKAMESGSK